MVLDERASEGLPLGVSRVNANPSLLFVSRAPIWPAALLPGQAESCVMDLQPESASEMIVERYVEGLRVLMN